MEKINPQPHKIKFLFYDSLDSFTLSLLKQLTKPIHAGRDTTAKYTQVGQQPNMEHKDHKTTQLHTALYEIKFKRKDNWLISHTTMLIVTHTLPGFLCTQRLSINN